MRGFTLKVRDTKTLAMYRAAPFGAGDSEVIERNVFSNIRGGWAMINECTAGGKNTAKQTLLA